MVSWARDGTLVGVDPEGTVYVGDDDLSSLVRMGSLGSQPQALCTENATTIHAASPAGLVVSDDGGATFRPLPTD